MNLRKFLAEDDGSIITAEYVIFVAAIGIILILGISFLWSAMRDLFRVWANYFQPTP